MSFDYSSIPVGYYFEAMLNGAPPQRFWHKNKFKKVLQSISLNATNVLDVGCAAGSLTYLASIYCPKFKITGVDVAKDQIDYAQKFVQPFCPQSSFFQIQSEDFPFASHSFDVVTTIELIEHLTSEEIYHLAKKIKFVLKPGGAWIITTPNYASFWPILEVGLNIFSPIKYENQHITKLTPRSLLDLVKNYGFKVDSVETFFLIAPFLSYFGNNFSEAVLKFESKLKLPGSLIISRLISS